MARIRPYSDADRRALIELIIECETYHRMPVPTKAKVEQSLLRLPAGVEVLVADESGKIAGFATFGTLYPAIAADPQFFMQELFVSEDYRRKNIGKELMAEVMRFAVSRGYTRVEWMTATDNRNAQDFYKNTGAKTVPRVVYRFENDDLIAAAKKLGQL